MALFNYATKEITLKIVYYGPGLSGKTTNLQYLHSILNPETKGKLLSLSTESDRTLFFDFLPIELGKIRDFSIRFQLYTVPGQVRYNATRKVVLKGADAVVFVADSQHAMREQNIESLSNMRENLLSNNINPEEIPIILQYNKRDLKNLSPIDELNNDLNPLNYQVIESSAVKGEGVEEAFKLITRLLLKYISKKHKIEILPIQEKEELKQPEAFTEQEGIAPMAAAIDLSQSGPEPEEIPWPETVDETREIFPKTTTVDSSALEALDEPLELGAGYELEEPAEKGSSAVYDSGPKTETGAEEEFAGKEKEAPVIALDKINLIADEIKKLNLILYDLQNSVLSLGKEIKEIKEIRREQKETNSILRDIINIFEGLRAKKSWFKF